MKWTPLPKGSFTGIHWAEPGATTGFDPYLVWAEASGFEGYARHRQPHWLTLAIELRPGKSVSELEAAASPAWLHIPPVYTSGIAPAGFGFCTARVKPAFFKHLAPGGSLESLIKRFELGMPLGSALDGQDTLRHGAAPPGGPRLKGKVLGLIDNGLSFANANFLTRADAPGKARTAYYWRQDRQGAGSTPVAMGYGHEITAADIDRVMKRLTFHGLVDEAAVYQHFQMGMPFDKQAHHGTHVMDLACGPRTLQSRVGGPDTPPSWAYADDDASRATLVAVQLDFNTVKDPSGGSVNAQVLDGLMYILSRCDAKAKVTVNISWGTLGGPHDGSSVLEAAMDQLIALRSGHLQVVLPAGNSYQSRMHANKTLASGESLVLHWHCQPGDSTQNFLELWLPPDAEGLDIEVTPAGHEPMAPLRIGQAGMWVNPAGKPLAALIYPRQVATGERGTCALLATAATFSFDGTQPTAPSGAWQVRLTNRARDKVTFDAYIERDDDLANLHTGARQSYFDDRHYDTSGNPGAFVDHPDNPTAIRRSGNFNSIATGRHTVTVGGTRLSDGSWARYSPRKPDPDRTRPQRPGVVKVPATEAPSDENQALQGVPAASTRSGGVVRLRGTSDAAPQEARRVLNRL